LKRSWWEHGGRVIAGNRWVSTFASMIDLGAGDKRLVGQRRRARREILPFGGFSLLGTSFLAESESGRIVLLWRNFVKESSA
jgi:hypothetical protein